MKRFFLILLSVCLLSACSSEKTGKFTNSNADENSVDVSNVVVEETKETPADVEVEKTVENSILTLFDYNTERGSEYNGYYDLNNDGNADEIKIYRDHQYNATYGSDFPVSKIEVNDKHYTFSGDIGAYDVIWVGICDIDIADGVKDIAFIDEGDAGNRKLCILKYDKSGNLFPYKFKQNAVWGAEETAECLQVSFATLDKIEMGSDGTLNAKNHTLNADNRVALTVDVAFRYSGNMILNEIVPEYYTVDNSYLNKSWYQASLSGEELAMCQQGYIKSECEYTDSGITLNIGDYFKLVRWRTDGFVYIEKHDGNNGWFFADMQKWSEISPRSFSF